MSVLKPKTAVALGDSLTYGFGTTYKLWTTRLSVDPTIYPVMVIGNCGLSGDRSDQMKVRYEACIKGRKPDLVILTGFVNNILQLESAATAWANAQLLVDEILADGSKVLLVHEGPAGNYAPGTSADWNASKQTEWLALAASMQAYADDVDVFFVDVYPDLGDPANPENLAPDDDSGDGLHWSENGAAKAAVKIATKLAQVFAPAAAAIDPQTWEGIIVLSVGDRAPTVLFQLKELDGTPRDLSAGTATVAFSLRPAAGGDPTVDHQPCTIVDAVNGMVLFKWPSGSTDLEGLYLGQFVCTQGGLETAYPVGASLVARIVARV